MPACLHFFWNDRATTLGRVSVKLLLRGQCLHTMDLMDLMDLTDSSDRISSEHRLSVDSLNAMFTSGADERLFLNERGEIKYGIALLDPERVNRGSCTCNPLSYDCLDVIERVVGTHRSDADWIGLRERQSGELAEQIRPGGGEELDLFFAPSGTDLIYYPQLFSRLLHPHQPILNIVTCTEELGSGTALAAHGRYFADFNQFGEPVERGEALIDPDMIGAHFISARSADGRIIDPEAEIRRLIETHPDHRIIVNLVFGSKSGIADNLEMIPSLQADNVLWNVDMCQFRHSQDIVVGLVRRGAMVMLTGSKFYQSAPFCGVLVAPRSLGTALAGVADFSPADRFARVFSRYDWPSRIGERRRLPGRINRAGILRWQTALEEIARFNRLDPARAADKIARWNRFVLGALQRDPHFEIMPDQSLTNPTIVSFRVRCGERYLDHDELTTLHRRLVAQDHHAARPFRKLFIGQPVAYTGRSFLRLAVGSKTVRQFVAADETEFALDAAVIAALRDAVGAFCADQR